MMEAATNNLSELDLCDNNSSSTDASCDSSGKKRPSLSSRIPRPMTVGTRTSFGFQPSVPPPRSPRSSSPSGSIEYRDGSDSSSFTTENGRSTPGGTTRRTITSKINSFANIKHAPEGGKVQVFSEKVDFSDVKGRCQSKANMKHRPGGGNIQVFDDKLNFKETAQSKVGSFKNSKHVAGGGDKKIESHSLNWEATSRVGSWKNFNHKAGGGDLQIENRKLNWETSSRVGTWKNANHKPGGGDKQIDNHELRWDATSKVGSWKNMKHKPGGGNVQIESQNLNWDTQSRVGSWKNFQHKPGGGNVQIVDEQLNWKTEARTKHRLQPKKEGAYTYYKGKQGNNDNEEFSGEEHPNYDEDISNSQVPLETDLDAEVAAVMP